jgi:hypothetical protein
MRCPLRTEAVAQTRLYATASARSRSAQVDTSDARRSSRAGVSGAAAETPAHRANRSLCVGRCGGPRGLVLLLAPRHQALDAVDDPLEAEGEVGVAITPGWIEDPGVERLAERGEPLGVNEG